MQIAAYFIAVLAAIPTAIFVTQCLAAIVATSFKRTNAAENQTDIAAAVIVPAHNEDQVLSATLDSLRPQLGTRGRVVVIAHNCSDATAQVARDAGAEVVEVNEPQQHGKGWALNAGRDYLRADPPDVMVIVDADTIVEEGFLPQVSAAAMQRQTPVQAKYVLDVDGNGTDATDHVSSFAFTVRNAVRPLGMKLLGLPCLLNGSGMALPWSLAAEAPLAGGHAGEDYKLGVDLALKGNRTYFCPEAVVRGPLPKTKRVAVTQRRRWSHSQLTFMRDDLPRLLGDFLWRGRLSSLGLACDLLVPPLVLLVLLQGAALAVTGVLWAAGGSAIPFVVAATTLVLFLATLFAVAVSFAPKSINRHVLWGVVRYFLRYLPQYLAFFRKADTQWTKTPRESGAT